MNDLISRQAAIEEVREATIIVEYKETDRLESVAASVIKQTKKGIEYLLEDLPTAPQWIPVEEGLPENKTTVLVSYKACSRDKFCETSVGRYSDSSGTWANIRGDYIPEVVAWMPLPEPYKRVA